MDTTVIDRAHEDHVWAKRPDWFTEADDIEYGHMVVAACCEAGFPTVLLSPRRQEPVPCEVLCRARRLVLDHIGIPYELRPGWWRTA